MNRDELDALRDAIDTLLTWPDAVRGQVARWLAPNDVGGNPPPASVTDKENNGAKDASGGNPPPKPNGRDPHPPPIAPMGTVDRDAGANSPPGARKTNKNGMGGGGNSPPGARRSPTPYAGKARASKSKAAERKLIATMEANPGASVAALAKAASASRSRTGDRLRQLAARGAIEKDDAGRWRIAGEKPRPPAGGPDPRPTSPPAS